MTPETVSQTPAAAWWSLCDVAAHLNVSHRQAGRLAKRADFPAARAFGARIRRWPVAEVTEWATRQVVLPTLYAPGGGSTAGVKRGPKGARRGAAA